MKKSQRIIIIGSGPAGLSAALYAARADFDPLVITGELTGGQLLKTSSVSNWPGILDIEGPTLIAALHDQAVQNGAQFLAGKATHVLLTEKEKIITLASGTILTAEAIIIACGTIANRLHCTNEHTYWSHGVYSKLPENLEPYAHKPVLIAGGGNSAITFADRLLNAQAYVTIIQAQEQLTASDRLTQRVLDHPNTQVRYRHTITELVGIQGALTTAIVTDQATKNTAKLDAVAVFLALGGRPNTDLFKDQLTLSKTGHIVVTPGTSQTSIPGVFSAGDVSDNRYRHAITSAAQGCMAALDAEQYLNGKVVVRFSRKK